MEDINGVSTLLVDSLRNAGYEVVAASGSTAPGNTASEQMVAPVSIGPFHPALIVLNLQMPQGNGQHMRYELRGQTDVPLLILTASAQDNDSQPMLGRLRTILHHDSHHERLAYGPLELDCDSRGVTIDGRPILLTPREFALLEMLVRNPGRTFSRNELLELCWGAGYSGVERVVDVHVVGLRRKLGRETLITTVRGVGYRLRDWREKHLASAH